MAIAVCAAASGVGRAEAFELLRVDGDPCGDSPNLFWADATARVDTNLLDPDSQRLADEARRRWNQSVRTFHFGGGIGRPCNGRDGIVSVGFGVTACDGSPLGGDVLALTRSIWRSSGELIDADVVLSQDASLLADDAVFLEVVMHELGHVLGLAHSDACGDSGAGTLMRSRLGPRRIDRPQPDDIAGAEAIYGRSGGSGGGAPSGGTGGCAVANGAAGGVFLLGVAVLVGLVGRRRRRRLREAP